VNRILACKSKKHFTPLLAPTRSNPLVWTTGLMCPEAYTLHDALTSYIRNEPTENVRSQAAKRMPGISVAAKKPRGIYWWRAGEFIQAGKY
jgi:hypothetical protein